jgi:hypothetical protein
MEGTRRVEIPAGTAVPVRRKAYRGEGNHIVPPEHLAAYKRAQAVERALNRLRTTNEKTSAILTDYLKELGA